MGVKRLTSFVNQIHHAVSEQVTIPVRGAEAPTSSSASPTTSTPPFVIDGCAWIYRAYLDNFTDAVRGGDYIRYTLHLRHFVNALRRAALQPIFVFDGPHLPLKIPTVLSRLADTASTNSAFMRSSSRSKPRFQISMGVFPPLLYDCTLEALRQSNVQIVIHEIEAHSAVAELADTMRGWAVSNDSDFFVLCSRGTTCRGYVPIDSLEYLVEPPSKTPSEDTQFSAVAAAAAAAAAADTFEDDGFAPVGRGGKARGNKGNKAVQAVQMQHQLLSSPPSSPEQGTLKAIRFMSYSSVKLAAALGITPSMLPLLAALVGNDYTAPIQKRILDPALPLGPQRITFIANAIKTETLRMANSGTRTPARSVRSGAATPSTTRTGLGRTASTWGALAARAAAFGGSATPSAAATPSGDAMHPKLDEALAALALNDPVRFMVSSVIQRILAGVATGTREAYLTSGEQEHLVDAVIDSVATYSLLSDPSAIHRSTPSAQFFRASQRQQKLGKYRKVYEEGYLDPVLVEAVTQRVATNRLAPEDPDVESIGVTHARDVRRWTYSVLFAAWGMGWARETMEEPVPEEKEGQDAERGHPGAIPILAGPGPKKVNWDEEGDPEELIPVQTPPSSFGSSMYDIDGDDEDSDEDTQDVVRSRPGSAVGFKDDNEGEERVKPAPAVSDYSRKGDRYVAELVPILTLGSLIAKHKEELGIDPPQVLRKYICS